MERVVLEHWNRFYSSRAVDETGFWEEIPEPSLRLIDRCALGADEPIIDAGGGASRLVDCLIDRGFRNLTVVDISQVALDRLRQRVGDSTVRTIQADLASPTALDDLVGVALWHDRAVLHFLVEPRQRAAYGEVVRRVVRPRGFVALAAFALAGAQECSDLPVHNYDAAEFSEILGPEFALVESFDHLYVNRDGDPRPFVYALFRRTAVAP